MCLQSQHGSVGGTFIPCMVPCLIPSWNVCSFLIFCNASGKSIPNTCSMMCSTSSSVNIVCFGKHDSQHVCMSSLLHRAYLIAWLILSARLFSRAILSTSRALVASAYWYTGKLHSTHIPLPQSHNLHLVIPVPSLLFHSHCTLPTWLRLSELWLITTTRDNSYRYTFLYA